MPRSRARAWQAASWRSAIHCMYSVKAEVVRVAVAQIGERLVARLLPRLRPFPPHLREAAAQHLKACEPRQRVALLVAKGFEIAAAFGRRGGTEDVIAKLKSAQLGARDAGVIDALGIAQHFDVVAEPGRRDAGKFRLPPRHRYRAR